MTAFPAKPPRSASPLIRELFAKIDASGRSYSDIAAQAGVHTVTLSYWRHGKNAPRWVDFENVAHVIGYRIVLEPLENAKPELTPLYISD
jgi:transcriptional regulator with XRE-family HTH domain